MPNKQISFISLLASKACSSSMLVKSLSTTWPKRSWPLGAVGGGGGGSGGAGRLVTANARHLSMVSVVLLFFGFLTGHNLVVADALAGADLTDVHGNVKSVSTHASRSSSSSSWSSSVGWRFAS